MLASISVFMEKLLGYKNTCGCLFVDLLTRRKDANTFRESCVALLSLFIENWIFG